VRKSVKEECLAVCPRLNLIIRGFSIICVYLYVLLTTKWNWLSEKFSLELKREKLKKKYIKGVNINLKVREVAGTLKRGNEPSNSIKCREFLD